MAPPRLRILCMAGMAFAAIPAAASAQQWREVDGYRVVRSIPGMWTQFEIQCQATNTPDTPIYMEVPRAHHVGVLPSTLRIEVSGRDNRPIYQDTIRGDPPVAVRPSDKAIGFFAYQDIGRDGRRFLRAIDRGTRLTLTWGEGQANTFQISLVGIAHPLRQTHCRHVLGD